MATPLDIILVNRNSGRHLCECLASIADADKTGITLYRVVVVDDVSSDDSLQGIEAVDLPIECIRNQSRTGYGGSCNRGAAGSDADYLLFLNTDARLLRDSLTIPVRYLEDADKADVAIVGVKLLETNGEVSRCCARFPTLRRLFIGIFGLDRLFPPLFLSHQMKEWDHLSIHKVDQVIGAFMLMRRSIFERLGGYDERFFVYMEDLDLSLRVWQLGYRSVYLSTAVAIHEGGGTADRAKAESLFFLLRSRIQYGFKHFGVPRGGLLLAATAMLEPITRLVLAACRGSVREMRETLRAYTMLWRVLPALLFAGARVQPHEDAVSQPLRHVARPQPQSPVGNSKVEN